MTRKSWRAAPQERSADREAHAHEDSDWRSARRQGDGWRGSASSRLRSCAHDAKSHGDHHAAPQRHTTRPPRPSQKRNLRTAPATAAATTHQPHQVRHPAQATDQGASTGGAASDTTSSYSCYSRYNASSGGGSNCSSSGSSSWADMADEDAAMERAGMALDLGELEAEHGWFRRMMAEHKAEVEAGHAAAEQARRSRRGKAAKKAARKAAADELAAAAALGGPASSSWREAAAPASEATACSPSCPAESAAAQQQQQQQQQHEDEAAASCGRLSPVISSDCDCAPAEAVEAVSGAARAGLLLGTAAAAAAAAAGISSISSRRGLHGGAYIRSLSLQSSASGESWSSEEDRALDEEFEALEAYCVAPDAAAKAAAVVKAAAAAKAAAVAAAKAVAEAWQKHEAEVACASAAAAAGGGTCAGADISAAKAAAAVMAVVELEAACGCGGAATRVAAYERLGLSAAWNCSYVFGCGRSA